MENRKIWLIADTHFGLRGDDDEWLDDYIGYFENIIVPYMKLNARKDDILIHCGDVFDNRSTIGLNTIYRVIKLFEEFSSIFNDIRITVGNHDTLKKSTNDITSINMLKYIPHIKVYYTPEVDVIDGKTCLFNPWVEDPVKEKELLASVSVDYVFGHLEIGGSQMSNRSGVKIEFQGGIKPSDFKNSQVYAGHIHIRQDNKNIHYIGNPYHKDRGDRDNEKGITILDFKTGKTEFIENTVTPRYMKENIYDILNLTVGDLKKRWSNNRIDLHMKSTDYTKCNFDELKSALGNCYKSFEPHGDTVIPELNIVSDINFNDARSSDDYIDDFLHNQDVDDNMMNEVKEKLIEYRDRL
jgi:DNA repair exonuclease SbcCD nuclease subunit